MTPENLKRINVLSGWTCWCGKKMTVGEYEAIKHCCIDCYFKQKEMSFPTDTEMLDWLEDNQKGYGKGWICRDATMGRGPRLHETGQEGAKSTAREAIAAAMKRAAK